MELLGSGARHLALLRKGGGDRRREAFLHEREREDVARRREWDNHDDGVWDQSDYVKEDSPQQRPVFGSGRVATTPHAKDRSDLGNITRKNADAAAGEGDG